MKDFAKVYGHGGEQILVKRDSNFATGRPEVRVYFQSKNPDLGLCSKSVSFSDSAVGDAAADTLFDTLTEKSARNFIADDLAVIDDTKGKV